MPNRLFWRRLFERGEYLSHLIRCGSGGDLEENGKIFRHSLEGRARAKMVLGPFAETKGPCHAGAKPGLNKILPIRIRP